MANYPYPVGTRVRRTLVVEGVVEGTFARTDEGRQFYVGPNPVGDVTYEVLAPVEPGVGAVILFPAGYVATRSRSNTVWMVSGSGANWTWDQMMDRSWLGPVFEVLKEGDDRG